jgi:predicted metal-binding membrane protein
VVEQVAPTVPLERQRHLILGLLLAIAAAAWGILIWQSVVSGLSMGPGMNMQAPLFLILWVDMMVAMMFPTAAPMILTFHRLQVEKRQRGQSFVSTWVFVAAYLIVWTLFGSLAFAAASGIQMVMKLSMLSMETTARLGGLVLVLAGIYQLTPLKRVCLTKCQTPVSFILSSWRDGVGGAFRMGLRHGAFCLGCCWLLFVILFPIGIMNVAAMAVITALIFAEKSLKFGRTIGSIAGLGLIGYGLLAVLVPAMMPTYMQGTPGM